MTDWKSAVILGKKRKQSKKISSDESDDDDEEFVVVSETDESSSDETDSVDDEEEIVKKLPPPSKKTKTTTSSATMSVADFFKKTAAVKIGDGGTKRAETEGSVSLSAPRVVTTPSLPPPPAQIQSLKNCTVVFSGELSIDRDSAKSLAESAGGKVTSAVSGKTTFLVLGSVLEDGRAVEEGSKYKKMLQLQQSGKGGPKPLTESEFFKLVGKQESGRDTSASSPIQSPPPPRVSSSSVPMMWVDKYEPQTLSDYVGNKSNVSKLLEWLKKWLEGGKRPSGAFKPSYPGARGGNPEAKAVLLSGPPGVGKSLLARLACEQLGFEKIEFNASDYRNKAHVDSIGVAISNTRGVFGSSSSSSSDHLRPVCLVMDECDGMSAGDRGGNAALIQVIKKSSIPIICICNDRMSAKVRSLANYCYDLKFVKPSKQEVVDRCRKILNFENFQNVPPNTVLEQIVEGADCDIRQTINQLEGDSFDWKSTILSYEKKDRSTMLTPFDACRLLMAPPPNMSLNDRLDLFFVDYDLIPLLVQQNYPKCFTPKEINGACKSAAFISQADCVSRAIRSEQNWSLLPEYGLLGTVFVPPKPEPGIGAPYPEFPVWLGKYSHSKKISRITQELQCIVSTNTSVTSRNILLSNYAHVMYVRFVKELKNAASASDDPALPTLDALGVHKNDLLDLLTELLLPWQSNLYQDIDPKTKATITRICNNHHMMIKSGAAHFRSAKSVSSGVVTSLADGGDEEGEEGEEEEQQSIGRKKKEQTDDLVKQAKVAKPKANKSRTKK